MTLLKFLILFILFITGCQPPMAHHESTGGLVICFGDSLTAGYGAAKGHDYPSYLRAKVKSRVFNLGMRGDNSNSALSRLESDVLMFNPKLVIITMGANDYMTGTPKERVLANMMKIIERIKARGATVVWAEVQMGALSDPYIPDFRALADYEHILLIPNILGGIIDHPEYKHDPIHPNDEGYKIMADRIYQKIKGLL